MIRVVGAALLVAGCGGFGVSLGAGHRREIRLLRTLQTTLQEMEWELKFRMTELPELCRVAADSAGGALGEIFRELSEKLYRREVEDIAGCLNAIQGNRELPRRVRKNLRQLGSSLGRFDLESQLQGLEAVRQQCVRDQEELEERGRQHLRCYQTLAVCAGAALAILLI